MNLPEIYKNKIDESIKNSQYTYYGISNREARDVNFNVLPVDTIIETKDRIFRARIIAKTNNYLITNKKEIVYIHDCISIKKG